MFECFVCKGDEDLTVDNYDDIKEQRLWYVALHVQRGCMMMQAVSFVYIMIYACVIKLCFHATDSFLQNLLKEGVWIFF